MFTFQMSDTIIAAAAYYVLTPQVQKQKRRRWWNRQLLFERRNLSQESFWSQLNADAGSLFKNFTRMRANFIIKLKCL
jgi:hypothetical protein